MKRATRAAFIRWLSAKPEDGFVGHAQQCTTCPLAMFLQFLEPGCMPHVDRDAWTRWEGDRTSPWRPMPNWALDVIAVADHLRQPFLYAGELRRALEYQLGWSFSA